MFIFLRKVCWMIMTRYLMKKFTSRIMNDSFCFNLITYIQADYKIRFNKGWVKKIRLGQIWASNKTYVYVNGSASIFFLHVVKWTRLVSTFFWNGPESYSISENIPSSSSSLKFMWSIRSIKFVAGSTSIACTSFSSTSSSFGDNS